MKPRIVSAARLSIPLAAANTYTGTTHIKAGILSIDTSGATGANFLALSGTVTLTQKALLMTGGNDFTIQSGTLGASASEVIVHQLGTGNLTISSTISGGTGSLTKDGSGTLTVTNGLAVSSPGPAA
ncbi:MAG: autotransporter-associated beta strand repeat-containing protein [Verrucomicrobiota bacterium]